MFWEKKKHIYKITASALNSSILKIMLWFFFQFRKTLSLFLAIKKYINAEYSCLNRYSHYLLWDISSSNQIVLCCSGRKKLPKLRGLSLLFLSFKNSGLQLTGRTKSTSKVMLYFCSISVAVIKNKKQKNPSLPPQLPTTTITKPSENKQLRESWVHLAWNLMLQSTIMVKSGDKPEVSNPVKSKENKHMNPTLLACSHLAFSS